MGKNFDHKRLNGLLVTVELRDDERGFIVEMLGGLPGSLLKRLQSCPLEKGRPAKCSLTFVELRKIINGLFTIALYNEDIEEEARCIAERLALCEHEALEALKKETEKV